MGHGCTAGRRPKQRRLVTPSAWPHKAKNWPHDLTEWMPDTGCDCPEHPDLTRQYKASIYSDMAKAVGQRVAKEAAQRTIAYLETNMDQMRAEIRERGTSD